MNYYLNKSADALGRFIDSTTHWGTPAWALLGFIVVFVGFVLLRGNKLRGA